MVKYLRAIFIVSTTFVVSIGNAQQDTLIRPKGKPLDRLLERESVAIDSNQLLTYTLDDIDARDSFKIKGLDPYFQQYDPARARPFDYGHLGNVGSAAYSTILEIPLINQFNLGYTQYDLYHKTINDIKHFEQVRPFSELYFSGGETQSDLKVGALFSRSFANDVNFVIDYDRISQQGIYQHQGTRQTSFLSSLAYRGNPRLSTFLSFILNASAEEINGGVQDLSSLSNPINDIRENVDVLSTDAESRLQNRSIVFNAFYYVGSDSLTSDFKTKLRYEAVSFNEFYRYSDPSISSDSTLYKSYWIGNRGIRNYNELNRIRNGLYFHNSFKNYYHFETGLRYDFNTIDLSGYKERLHEIYLTFKGALNIKDRLLIKTDVFYGLLDAANEFGLNANAELRLTRNQGFLFSFLAGRYRVNKVQEQLLLNQDFFYENSLNPLLLQTLKAEYFNETWKIRLGGQLQNTFNYVYFDISSFPNQDSGLYSVLVFYGQWDISLGKFLLENSAYLQNQNKVHVNLPSIFTKNSLSFYDYIFKDKMLLKAGFDFRYIFSEYLPFYNPVIGQFYLNDQRLYSPYPMLDARISFKVSSFTTFVKYENLAFFIRDDVEQLVQGYPQFDARFRFGIQWNLWN
ncbi:putative porin [Portibacter marinus]|uniref:putative porin n=1 Tax=Portibacter marinus TaxID=2898660 RepID=UPI001F380CFC|nr:putative porin [Portibacter marinus]